MDGVSAQSQLLALQSLSIKALETSLDAAELALTVVDSGSGPAASVAGLGENIDLMA